MVWKDPILKSNFEIADNLTFLSAPEGEFMFDMMVMAWW
jgi:hypothetical protein